MRARALSTIWILSGLDKGHSSYFAEETRISRTRSISVEIFLKASPTHGPANTFRLVPQPSLSATKKFRPVYLVLAPNTQCALEPSRRYLPRVPSPPRSRCCRRTSPGIGAGKGLAPTSDFAPTMLRELIPCAAFSAETLAVWRYPSCNWLQPGTPGGGSTPRTDIWNDGTIRAFWLTA
jgi:hypothetical protein